MIAQGSLTDRPRIDFNGLKDRFWANFSVYKLKFTFCDLKNRYELALIYELALLLSEHTRAPQSTA